MNSRRKQLVYELLKGIETGDPNSTKVVNEAKYIQHNPQTHEGGEGLAQLFARLSKTNPKVEIVRLFEDGDFVFGHTIYNFAKENIGFEVFRYEGDFVVEHWDNIQPRIGDMVGGTRESSDQNKTEDNRSLVSDFINNVIIPKCGNQFSKFLATDSYVEHSTFMPLSEKINKLDYSKNHRLLVDGDFVLSINEGVKNNAPTSFYDLFRVESGKIVEHWDTIEEIPPRSEWKNDNGKF